MYRRFAKRTGWNRKTNPIHLLLEELKAGGAGIIDLTESNPTHCGFDYPTAIMDSLSDPRNLEYAPAARGVAHARQSVGRFCHFDPQRVMLTSSTSESYSFLFRLLLDAGDRVLIPCPSYPLFQFLLELNDASYAHYPLRYDGQWRVDFQALERLVDGKTKAIVLVNPNNPTGSYLKADDVRQLNDFCRKHELVIISDEVFFDYPLTAGPFVSLKGNPEVLTFTLGGLSKCMGLPQMKLGWILASGPDGALNEALARLEIIGDTYLSVNTPAQNACETWLAQAPIMRQQILARIQANLNFLMACGFNVLRVEGGWYAIIGMGQVDEEDLVLDMLRHHHILVHPGFLFDLPAPGQLILSLLPPPPQFAKIEFLLGESYGKKTGLG